MTAEGQEPLKLSIVVLAWDQMTHTRRCVASIRNHTSVEYELIIVDNGSMPPARAFAEQAADRVVLNPTNLGFAAGMNAGLAVATAPAVAFVTNDTVLPEGWAPRLLATLRSGQHVGIVSPAVVTTATSSGPVWPTDQSEADLQPRVLSPFEPAPAAIVWLMDRAVATELGGFDPRYFASGEDLDLAFKIWVNELDIVLDPAVVVGHVGRGTAEEKLPDWRATWQAGAELFLKSWDEPVDIPRLAAVDPARFERNLAIAASTAGWMSRYSRLRHSPPKRRWLAKLLRPRSNFTRSRRWPQPAR